MSSELTTLMKHGTWDLVPIPLNCNPVGCEWVFRVKRKPDGLVDWFKARLVAKGYNQCPDLDYKETFSLVVKPATLRTILSIIVVNGWDLRQMDVNNAYMVHYLRLYIWCNPRASKIHLNPIMFEGSKRQYMASNKLLGLGTLHWKMYFLSLGLTIPELICLCLFIENTL